MLRLVTVIGVLFCISATTARCVPPNEEENLERLNRRFEELTISFNNLKAAYTKKSIIVSGEVLKEDTISRFPISRKLNIPTVIFCRELIKTELTNQLRLTRQWKDYSALQREVKSETENDGFVIMCNRNYEKIKSSLSKLNGNNLCYDRVEFINAVQKVTKWMKEFTSKDIELLGKKVDAITVLKNKAQSEYDSVLDSMDKIVKSLKTKPDIKHCMHGDKSRIRPGNNYDKVFNEVGKKQNN